MSITTLAGGLIALALVSHAHGQASPSWVGKRVVKTHKTPLMLGGRAVDDASAFRSYTVVEVDGGWLMLASGSVRGYVPESSVVPFDQAVDHFSRDVRDNPGSSGALVNRGLIWTEKGKIDLAIADFTEAIRVDPRDASGYSNRGNARSSKKEYDKAIADFDEAIRLDPRTARLFANRGNAWNFKKEYDRAISDYKEAIRLDPAIAQAFDGRGYSWGRKGRHDRAIADYNEAVRLDPKFEWPYNNRAWTWATCPDPKYRDARKAVESATRACELTEGKAVTCLGTLAAAHAEAGDFSKAVEFQNRANRLYKDDDDRKAGLERLRLYQRKKPYRDEG